MLCLKYRGECGTEPVVFRCATQGTACSLAGICGHGECKCSTHGTSAQTRPLLRTALSPAGKLGPVSLSIAMDLHLLFADVQRLLYTVFIPIFWSSRPST